jgi:predicted ATPase/class 3 adenylate cyclase
MTFAEVLTQLRELLQSKGRVSYRALKLQFNLDEDYLEGLKDELIEAEHVAADEDGKVLVWVGASPVPSSKFQVPSFNQPPTPTPQSLAERRHLTVLFCDLVGSTALSEQLDPEEYREVVRAYQQTSAAVIERFDGHIAQYLGDGLLVYFGYPVAHEDDAARAVRAGLEIIETIQKQAPSPLGGEGSYSPSPFQGEGRGEGNAQPLSPHTPHPNLLPLGEKELRRLQVRIGIHTGLVVVGEVGGGEKRELLALGETPNIAARIQGLTEPNTVAISAATYRLVEGLFEYQPLGSHTLKGISAALTLYRVVKAGEAQSRFQVVVRKGLTPLVGREHEFGMLRQRWARAKEGEGQVVLFSGEPGIGKSRLVEALKEAVEHDGASCLELRCSPYHQNSALYPVIEYLQRALQFQQADSPDVKLHKLEAALVGATSRSPLHEIVPLFAALLSLPLPERYPSLTLSPQKQKEKTHEALVSWLCAEAKQQAVVYAWEDLHWADPSTLELLTLLLAQVPTTRLLAILTFRPEFTPSWGTHSYLSQVTLSRLGRTHVEAMVGHVIAQTLRPSTSSGRTESDLDGENAPVRAEPVEARTALSSEIIQQIVNKTDGVPLFVEELTKSVIESVGSLESVESIGSTIPTTLQDSLMARLDRLGTAKEIAQMGATIGREFTYDLLQTIFPLDEETLQRGLKQLVEAELVYQSGTPPQARYLFKHALVQETAYQSLLKSRRQQLHQQVAQVLANQFPQTVEVQPELLAHHYTEAGLSAEAIPYWQRAGQLAAQRSANLEAISHLTKGLELLKTLPDTPERAQQELTLQIALGSPLMVTKGYGAPEVQKTYTRARELGRQVGETPQLFPILWGLWEVHAGGAQYKAARELAEQCLTLAQSSHDPLLLVEAHYALGGTLLALGELATARGHYEDLLALYDPRQHAAYAALYVHDPGVIARCYVALTLWYLGYPDQALKRLHEALSLARELSDSYSLGATLAWGAPSLHQHCREEQAAREQAEAGMTLASEQEFSFLLAMGTMLRGWALAEQGQGKEGIAQIRQGLDAYCATGAEYQRTFFLSLLAEACRKAGRVEDGLRALAEALAMVYHTGECFYEAELYRLKGELTLQKFQVPSSKFQVPPNPQPLIPSTQAESEAEACFHKAIEIARKQQAKSLELRATVSLARLWQQQGKQHAARNALSEIYNWFTEGLDTKDLQEAKALLEKLS